MGLATWIWMRAVHGIHDKQGHQFIHLKHKFEGVWHLEFPWIFDINANYCDELGMTTYNILLVDFLQS